MRTDTADKIIKYLQKNNQASAKDLVSYLEISPQAVFRQLAKLIEKKEIAKTGRPPKVFYHTVSKKNQKNEDNTYLNEDIRRIINDRFLVVTPDGQKKQGIEGFGYWCQKTGQSVEKTALEYIKTLEKYDAFKRQGFVDGIKKLNSTFVHVYLDHLYYLDFYSIERFGKTKLGTMLLYAKQSQNKILIKELLKDIEPKIRRLVKKYNIDAIGFIPPTVKRDIQFMKEIELHFNLKIPKINLVKVKTEVVIPQKTLSKLEDRVENAEKTIVVDDKTIYRNILLVDDAVGSGATLNMTAKQIKDKGICRGKIIGLAITGSFKGFDVISEV